MTDDDPGQQAREPTEEELRAALEEEMKRITVDDVLLQTAVSLINLAGRRAGLAPGSEEERDLAQVQTAIDGVSALLELLERGGHASQLGPLRDALAQLQLAFTRQSAETPAAPGVASPSDATGKDPEGEAAPETKPATGPAQSSGRLWVPGQ